MIKYVKWLRLTMKALRLVDFKTGVTIKRGKARIKLVLSSEMER